MTDLELKARRLISILEGISILLERDEEVELVELSRQTKIPFIQLNKDIGTMIELNLITLEDMKSFKYTQYVKRYTKSKGKVFKAVRYFAK